MQQKDLSKLFTILIIATMIITINTFSSQNSHILDENSKNEIINTTRILWPMPKRISSNTSAQNIEFDLQDIAFKVEALGDNVQNLLNFYLANVFKIQKQKTSKGPQITMNIVVKNTKQVTAEVLEHEKYQITIRQNQKWELIADYYPGFVRGLETFTQLLEKQPNGKYLIKNRPVLIDDQPDYIWRGLMIDTSRHFLPVNTIKKIMDGMMYNKMNILHWHIIDQDSFPMQIPTRPQLHKSGSLSGTYPPQTLSQLQQYAALRSIRIIPQYDTPAHTRSWGRSQKYQNMTLEGELPYQGQFDPTISLTYDVLLDVIKYVNTAFGDRYQHLGGDQVEDEVWDKRSSIKDWMKNNNVSSYEELEVYYRRKQRQMLRDTNSSKKAIYWANQQINLPVEENDVIQWWGETVNIDQIKIHKNQIILSNYDLAYLDVGFGDQLGDPYQTQISWRDMYKFNPIIEGVNVIGGEACMWAETVTPQNIQQKVWIRSSVIAQRLWNTKIDIKIELLNIVYRLIQQRKRMQSRGYKVSPVTVGLCEKDPTICFN